MPSVRDLIIQHRNRLAQGNLPLPEAAEMLNQITALMGNVNDEALDREMSYNTLLHETLKNDVSVASAKIVAHASPQYRAWREAVNAQSDVVEMVRTLKYYLKSLAEEQRQSGNL